MLPFPSPQEIAASKAQVLERIRNHHLRRFAGSKGKIFYISDAYPGVWLEHTYDAVAWGCLYPEESEIAMNQVRLFLDHQKPDGQLPCYIWKDQVGYGQLQEGVSFARLCYETAKMNDNLAFMRRCYESCKKWEAWLVEHRMDPDIGLLKTYCGYDTGHDNSARFADTKYPGDMTTAEPRDAKVPPTDDPLLPFYSPDINAVFFNTRTALADMAMTLSNLEKAAQWRSKADQIRDRLFHYCYDAEDQFFYDVDRNLHRRKIKSIAITSLFCEHVLEVWDAQKIFLRYFEDAREFRTPYPYPSLSVSDPHWAQNKPGNSWNFYSQGLTALRSLRWMDRYGFGYQQKENMRAWVAAWTNSQSTRFGQELHPLTGAPSNASAYYSSTMLYYLYALERLGY